MESLTHRLDPVHRPEPTRTTTDSTLPPHIGPTHLHLINAGDLWEGSAVHPGNPRVVVETCRRKVGGRPRGASYAIISLWRKTMVAMERRPCVPCLMWLPRTLSRKRKLGSCLICACCGDF